MKKSSYIILFSTLFSLIIICILLLMTDKPHNLNYTYSPKAAVEYSYKYIKNRNPQYANFEHNCVNYVSQCLVAGGLKMNKKQLNSLNKTKVKYSTDEWFSYRYDNDPHKEYTYHVSTAFSHNLFFIKYWKDIEKIPYNKLENTAENRKFLRENIQVGDIIILHSKISHAAIIVKIDENEIYYNSNTKDRDTYPLSLVNENTYKEISYFKFVK